MRIRTVLVSALVSLGLLAGVTSAVLADGNETLGAPSIPISSGSGTVVAGTGLFTQPAAIAIEVPGDALVEQVLLYWQQQTVEGDTGDDTVTVDGFEVTGMLIGETFGEWDCCLSPNLMHRSYRADITGLDAVSPGLNSVSIDGLDAGAFERKEANGAALLVIYDDGTSAEINILDGSDFAYNRTNLSGSLLVTEAQTFTFAPEAALRTATLDLLVADISSPETEIRDAAVDVTVDGFTTRYSNILEAADGDQWDTLRMDVDIPAGIGEVTVQLFSIDDGPNRAESFVWVGSALSVPTAPPPSGSGEGCTPGFWKNHLDAWVGFAPSDDAETVFAVAGVFNGVDTLEDALNQGGGKDKALGRHAVAALLNASSAEVSYDMSTAAIIALVQDAYVTGKFNAAKNMLAGFNEQGCPTNGK